MTVEQRAVTVLSASSLDDVASAVTEYVMTGDTKVYVERHGSQYRWSPVHHGGPYPLLRILARYLGCEHTELVMPFVTVDGYAIVADPAEPRSHPWGIIDAASLDPSAVAAAIERATSGAVHEDRRPR